MSPSPSAPDVESPSSPTSPSPAPLPSSGLFLPPKGPAALLPPPSPSSSTSSPADSPSLQSDAGEAPPWSGGYADSEATSESLPGNSGTPSTGSPVSRAGLRSVLRGAVRTVTNAVASIAADASEQQYGLWRADRDDVDGMSEPAARILYRKLPEEARDSDALDLFGLGLALAAYIGKNLKRKAALRALRETGQLVDAGDGLTGVFVPSGDAGADAAAADAWGVPGYPYPAAAATS
jgi:hypothetical protein